MTSKIESRARRVLILLLALVLAASFSPAQPARAQTDPGINATQTVSPNPATVGQPYTVTVTVTNNSVPQHVGIKNFFRPGVEFVSATPSQGACGVSHHGNNAVECSLGQLSNGESAVVEIVANPTVSGTLTNTVVSGGESTPQERDVATFTVNPAG